MRGKSDTLEGADDLIQKAKSRQKVPTTRFTEEGWKATKRYEEEQDNQVVQEILAAQESPASNLVVALSRERIERERLRSKVPQITSSSRNAKTKKKKAQRLGGTKKSSVSGAQIDDFDELDDIAFLDSQIEKVQTAHGRKVDGHSGYRTIINGILTAKPIPHEDKKDKRASTVLQSKLKQAQNSRKANVKKK